MGIATLWATIRMSSAIVVGGHMIRFHVHIYYRYNDASQHQLYLFGKQA